MDDKKYHRSFADPLASTLVLTSLDLEDWMTDLTLKRQFPLPAIPQFAHEFTHQWCSTSPLGYTLCLLSFRAQRFALASLSASTKAERERLRAQCERDWLRVRMCQSLLLPIAEGLAEFAEHDVSPGHSATIGEAFSTLAALVAGNRGDKRALSSDRLFENLRLVLHDARDSDAHVERKANLLLEPLSARRSPYLCGYLAIKNMWFSALNQATDHFKDPEFFLYYCKAFFYDDWDWVYLLLKGDILFPDLLAETLLKFLEIRLEDFHSNISSHNAEAFVQRVLHRENYALQFSHATDLADFGFRFDQVSDASTEIAEAQQLLGSLVDDVLSIQAYESAEDLVALWLSLLALRNFVTLGRATFSAKRKGHALVVERADGKPLAIFPHHDLLPTDWDGKVTVVSTYSIARLTFWLVFLAGNKVIWTNSEWGELNNPDQALTFSPMVDPEIRFHNLGIAESLIREACPDIDSRFALGWNHVENNFEQVMANASLLFEKDVKGSFSVMKEKGLLGATGDLAMVEDIAVLSLPGATLKSIDFPRKRSLKKLRERRDEISSLLAQRGYRPLHFKGDAVYFSFC